MRPRDGESGHLERAVLEVLWRDGEASVRDVLERLGTGHAYTTILTVLQRLHDKHVVRRRRSGAAWLYRAADSKETSLARRLHALLGEAGTDREAVLMAFVDTAASADPEVLDKLEQLLRARRRDKERT